MVEKTPHTQEKYLGAPKTVEKAERQIFHRARPSCELCCFRVCVSREQEIYHPSPFRYFPENAEGRCATRPGCHNFGRFRDEQSSSFSRNRESSGSRSLLTSFPSAFRKIALQISRSSEWRGLGTRPQRTRGGVLSALIAMFASCLVCSIFLMKQETLYDNNKRSYGSHNSTRFLVD